jgi:hypothetical protein
LLVPPGPDRGPDKADRPFYGGKAIEYICDGAADDTIQPLWIPTRMTPNGDNEPCRVAFFGAYNGWWILTYSSVDGAFASLGADAGMLEIRLVELSDNHGFIRTSQASGYRIALDARRQSDNAMHFREIVPSKH